MYYENLIQNFRKRVEDIRRSQSELEDELLNTEKWLDKLIDNMDSVNKRLKQIESQKVVLQSMPPSEVYRMKKVKKEALKRGKDALNTICFEVGRGVGILRYLFDE